jgi:uncharacterized protein YjdB
MTFRNRWFAASLLLISSLLVTACGSSSPTPPPTLSSIAVTPSTATLAKDATRQLSVSGTYSDGSVAPLTSTSTFSSSAASVATVNAAGLVTAVAGGSATITATSSGKSATAVITVTPTLLSIAATPTTTSLSLGGTQALTVTATYDAGAPTTVTSTATYTSSAAAVATVSAAGVVTAVTPGTATITATYLTKTATVAVTVNAPVIQSIAVSPTTKTLSIGATQALAVTATYDVGPTVNVTSTATYTSSASAVATVSAAGVVTGVAAGTATITATYLTKTATVAVTVNPVVLQSIAITPAAPTLSVVGTVALTVTATYDIGPSADVTVDATYASSATSVATVSAAGVVSAVGPGSATITATYQTKTATSAVTVTTPLLLSIAVAPTTVGLVPGNSQALTVTATYDAGPTANVTGTATYATSDALVATVSPAGVVTAVAVGTATITASLGGQTATSAVTVSAVPVGSRVFWGDFDAGVTFVGFGGSTNDVTVDATTVNNGRPSLKVVVPSGGYTGGGLVASVPRDLRAFNAVTFWAKSTVTGNPLNMAGVGDNATTSPPPFSAEALNFDVNTTWKKFVIPLPDPAKLVGSNALFHFAEGGDNYTLWFSDIQYENLPVTEVGPPTGVTVNWPGLNVGTGSTAQIPYQPNTVSFAVPAIPTGGSLKNVSFAWYTLTSSNPAVATVSATGLVTGLTAGTTNISATMNGLPVPGSAAITVTAPLAVPLTIATAPALPAGNVISLFTSVYTNVGIDTWRTGWSVGGNELVDPYDISGHNVKKYTLHNFVGIEFTGLNTIDGTAMTTFHVDVWSPNPATNLEIQLVNNAVGTAAIGHYQAGLIATGSWVSLEVPLTSFTGLTAKNLLDQILFVASGPMVLYVDNVYLHN